MGASGQPELHNEHPLLGTRPSPQNSSQTPSTHTCNSSPRKIWVGGSEVQGHFISYFSVAVTKYLEQKELRRNAFVWAPVADGKSPSWQKGAAARQQQKHGRKPREHTSNHAQEAKRVNWKCREAVDSQNPRSKTASPFFPPPPKTAHQVGTRYSGHFSLKASQSWVNKFEARLSDRDPVSPRPLSPTTLSWWEDGKSGWQACLGFPRVSSCLHSQSSDAETPQPWTIHTV